MRIATKSATGSSVSGVSGDRSVGLTTVSYATKPIYVFGGFGALAFFCSVLAGATALGFKLAPPESGWHKDFVSTPLPIFAVGFFAIGVQTILIGLLAEMLMRTYYEAQGKPVYLVRSVKRGGGKEEHRIQNPESRSSH